MHQEQTKERVIQEYVPGKQITLLHLIANPNGQIHKKLGLEGDSSAIGIITITPGEASIIASDVATKSGAIEIGFLDRFTGAVVIRGDVSAIEHALNQVKYVMGQVMQFSACEMTRT